MRISYISPFPPTRHGIGTYTHYLYKALSKIDSESEFLIVADKLTTRIATRNLHVVPSFDLNEALDKDEKPDYVEDIIRVITERSPEIVHVQHGLSIFYPDDRFLNLLEQLRKRTRLVLTLHAVFTDGTSGLQDMTMGEEEYHYRMSQLVDAIVAHQTSMREALIAQGVDGQLIHVIPHGTEILEQVDTRKARRRLGLPVDGRIILSFGFFGGRKNIELLIDALPHVLHEVPDVYLFVSGYVREWIREDVEKRELYEERAEQLGVRDHVIFAKRFIPDNEIHLVFSAVDVAAFPYSEAYFSASGSLHLAIGAFQPVVVSRTPKFEEVWREISSEMAFDPNRPPELANILVRLLIDSEFRESMTTRVKSYALNTSWDVIARAHLQLYDSLRVA